MRNRGSYIVLHAILALIALASWLERVPTVQSINVGAEKEKGKTSKVMRHEDMKKALKARQTHNDNAEVVADRDTGGQDYDNDDSNNNNNKNFDANVQDRQQHQAKQEQKMHSHMEIGQEKKKRPPTMLGLGAHARLMNQRTNVKVGQGNRNHGAQPVLNRMSKQMPRKTGKKNVGNTRAVKNRMKKPFGIDLEHIHNEPRDQLEKELVKALKQNRILRKILLKRRKLANRKQTTKGRSDKLMPERTNKNLVADRSNNLMAEQHKVSWTQNRQQQQNQDDNDVSPLATKIQRPRGTSHKGTVKIGSRMHMKRQRKKTNKKMVQQNRLALNRQEKDKKRLRAEIERGKQELKRLEKQNNGDLENTASSVKQAKMTKNNRRMKLKNRMGKRVGKMGKMGHRWPKRAGKLAKNRLRGRGLNHNRVMHAPEGKPPNNGKTVGGKGAKATGKGGQRQGGDKGKKVKGGGVGQRQGGDKGRAEKGKGGGTDKDGQHGGHSGDEDAKRGAKGPRGDKGKGARKDVRKDKKQNEDRKKKQQVRSRSGTGKSDKPHQEDKFFGKSGLPKQGGSENKKPSGEKNKQDANSSNDVMADAAMAEKIMSMDEDLGDMENRK